jgi:homocysteine S-methyltransferase
VEQQIVDPLRPFLERQGYVVLDGGLATELERGGFDLSGDLWSARVLLDAPERLLEVYDAYLRAGADIVATATYQATLPGFARLGLDEDVAGELFALAVRLASQARDAFAADLPPDRLRPLVAGSVGPWGAHLADGSEYRGDYAPGRRALADFHRPRWRALVEAGVDLLACETIPTAEETRALTDLLGETPRVGAWISLSCRDARTLADGTPVAAVAGELDAHAGVLAVGVNCVEPEWIDGLIAELRSGTGKPLFVYPNLGGTWDATARVWRQPAVSLDWRRAAVRWRRLGAAGVGGCCRVGPAEIARVRAGLRAAAVETSATAGPIGVDGEPAGRTAGGPGGIATTSLPDREADVVCPTCGESVAIRLDPAGGATQRYVEDCEVCCRPWSVTVAYDREGRATVGVEPAND